MIPAGPHEKKAELRALTGLRAVAALAVVVSHTRVPPSAPRSIEKLAEWGHIGVPLFFMLSGFVLAYNYPGLTYRHGKRTVAFYIARIARVMPLYWVMIAYSVAFYFAVGHEQYPSALLQNVFAVQAWGSDLLTAQSRYNGPGWSIGVELFFYALFPFLAPLVAGLARRYRVRGMTLIVLGGGVVSLVLWAIFVRQGWAALPAADGRSAHRWLYRNPLPHLVEFVVGMALAYAFPMMRPWAVRTHHLVQALVLAYVVLLATMRPDGSPAFASGSFGAFFVIPFAVAMVSLASGRGWFARVLSTRPLVALGAASYALYLTHRWFIWQLSTGDSIRTGTDWAPYVALVVTIIILLFIGEGAHRYVEVPARSWILNRSRRWLKPTGQTPVTPVTPVTPAASDSPAEVTVSPVPARP